MASKKDAKVCYDWLANILIRQVDDEAYQKEIKDAENLLKSAQNMKHDIKSSYDKHHTEVMKMIEENRSWRVKAEARQQQMRSTVSGALGVTDGNQNLQRREDTWVTF